MKIGIIGATGKTGREIYAQAVARGHRATAIVRSQDRADEVLGATADVVVRDALSLTAADLAPYDVVVDAFGTVPAEAEQQVELAGRLVREAGTLGAQAPRLVFILGSGSLRTADGHLFLEDLRRMPGSAAWVNIPVQQLAELELLRGSDVEWVGLSPAASFEPGEAATPVLGGDEILFDEDGVSRVTTGTVAVAILDEIEQPAHRNERFTVRNG